MNFVVAVFVSVLAFFAAAAFIKVCGWYWRVLVQLDSDVYGGRYDWIYIVSTPFAIVWAISTISLFDTGKFDVDYAPIYAMLVFFGPLAFVAGFLRAVGFGNTRIGKALGFNPPTEQKS